MSRPLVIGIGNPDRADDGVGWRVARSMEDVTGTVLSAGDPAQLIDLWEGEEEVILVDAVVTGAKPGSLTVLDLTEQDPPAGAGTSTHGYGAGEAVALGRALGRLPGRLLLVGIEGSDFGTGRDPTPAALAGVDRAVDLISYWCGGSSAG